MTTESQPAESTQSKPEDASRGRSTVEFTYFDLASAIEVANAVKKMGGTSAADWTSVAVKLSMAGDGGGFRQRVMTAKSFNVVDYSRGSITLTDLGSRIVDEQHERAAKVEAFLKVPLYRALLDKLIGQPLPPAAAVERMAEQLGVAPKQKDKARQVFMRSAKQAGFFEISSERLAMPPGATSAGSQRVARGEDSDASIKASRSVGGDGGDGQQPGRLRFEVPIPGKPSAVVMVPDDLDADDWAMLSSMMTTYIERWKKFSTSSKVAAP